MTADAHVEPGTVRKRPPRSMNVVWDPLPQEIGAVVDWSEWYLTDEEDMGEGGEQNLIIRFFLSILTQLASEQGWKSVHIGADQFFAWVEEEPLVRVSPDVYLLDDPPPRPLPQSWQTWRPDHHPPRFALEIVSTDWQKDYETNPPKYAQLGVRELVIFDPQAVAGSTTSDKRVPLQVFRRDSDGLFTRVHKGPGPVWSEELEAALVTIIEGETASLGLCRDVEGLDAISTVEDALQSEKKAHREAEAKIAELEKRLAELEK